MPVQFALGSRVGRWVRGLGAGAVLSLIAVPLMPSERFGRVHATLSLAAGSLGVASALAAVCALWSSNRRVLALLGALTLALCAFDGALFTYHLSDAAPPPLIVPALQKVAALSLVIWIASVAWIVLRGHDGERMKADHSKEVP